MIYHRSRHPHPCLSHFVTYHHEFAIHRAKEFSCLVHLAICYYCYPELEVDARFYFLPFRGLVLESYRSKLLQIPSTQAVAEAMILRTLAYESETSDVKETSVVLFV